MTVPDVHSPVRTPTIPRPRTAERAPLPFPVPGVRPEPVPELPAARYPWPEPWGSFRGNPQRTEFWDVATATWHSRGPRPHPRSGD